MKETEEFEQLAKDFVDLWQQHLAQTLSDPALAAWATAWLASMPAAAPGDGEPGGTAPAGAAPGAVGQRLDELASRLARCEERLDSLEGKSLPKGRGTS